MATEKGRTRRAARSGGRPRSYSELYKGRAAQATSSQAATGGQPELGGKQAMVISWKSEYAYVLQDLKILSIVSVVLFSAIIAAQFFI